MLRTSLPRPIDRLPLSRGGLMVSPFCIGVVDDPSTVSAAFDLGINFFFLTADMHWPVYEPLRRGLADLLARRPSVRDDLVVAVVSYVAQPAFSVLPFQEVLDNVPGLGRVDVSVIGGAYRQDFFPRLESFRNHRHPANLGVRAVGASFHDRVAAALALEHHAVDIAYARYNPRHAGAERDLFPRLGPGPRPLLYNFKSTWGYVGPARCDALGVPADGWRPEPGDYFRFVLSRSEMDGLLCSPRTPAEVRALVDVLERGPLDADECAYLRNLSALDRGELSL